MRSERAMDKARGNRGDPTLLWTVRCPERAQFERLLAAGYGKKQGFA